jgi:hypothetical protein
MRLALAVGVALAAVTLAASAHTNNHSRVVIRHGGPDVNIDANDDGWVTRDEAAAAADRAYDWMDRNDDGRLDREDHAAAREFDIRIDGPEVRVLEGGEDGDRRVRVIRRGDLDEETRARVEREIERAEREVERAEREAERAERHAERAVREAERRVEEAERHAEQAARHAERAAEHAERHAERAAEAAERHVERHVIFINGDDDDFDIAVPPIPPVPPLPPMPAHPPMFLMLFANSEEADLNNDGSLSREEFRDQHLRFFDASDANGDGRVRFDTPDPPAAAEPAEPPEPPTPPEPPRRR